MLLPIQPEDLKIVRDYQSYLIEIDDAQILEALLGLAGKEMPSPEVIHAKHNYDGEALYELEMALRVVATKLTKLSDEIEEFNQ